MVQSKAKMVAQYLRGLPAERRKALEAVRRVILKNLPKGYQETVNWGMIAYEIPLERYPETYNGQPLCYAALGSQKNHMAVYLTSIYAHKPTEKWFRERYKASGKKLDCAKSCVRFRRLDDLPLDLIGETVARFPVDEYLRRYEQLRKK